MKKILTLILTLVLLAGIVACASKSETETFEPNVQEMTENPVPAVPGAQEDSANLTDNSTPFQLPEMTVEQQHFYDDYVHRLLFSELLTRSWSLENYSNLYIKSGSWPATFLIFAFEDIIGREAMLTIWQEHGTYIPAEIVERVLLRYFPFTVEQLREVTLYSIYDEASNSYIYGGGRGGAPRAGVVTGIEREGEFVKLSYNLYGPGIGSHGIDTMWFSGILTLREVDDRFMYWSVEVTYERER